MKTDNPWLILISALGLIAIFLVFEFFSRRYKWSSEEMRRIAHIVGALFGVGIGIYFSKSVFIVTALAFFLLMIISHQNRIFNHIHGVSRKTIGEELLPLGLLGAYLIANTNPQIFVPAFLITGISDPISGFIINKTKNRLFSFLSFVASAAILLLIFTSLNFFLVFALALLVGIIEQVFSYGTDNLTVPIAVALMLSKLL